MGFRKGKIISGCLKTGHVVLLIAYCLLLIAVFTGCGRRADPFLPSYDDKSHTEDIDKNKDGKKGTGEALIKEDIKRVEDSAAASPEAPAAPAAVYTGKSIVLTWNEVLEQGVMSYRIYRASGDGYKLAGETVTPAFTDRDITQGIKYYYRVTAVGQSESLPSEEILVSTENQ